VTKITNKLTALDKEIANNTGLMTANQIIDKAMLLEYLGKPGEAIKIYEEHFAE